MTGRVRSDCSTVRPNTGCEIPASYVCGVQIGIVGVVLMFQKYIQVPVQINKRRIEEVLLQNDRDR